MLLTSKDIAVLINSNPEMFCLLMTVAMTTLLCLSYILNRMWEQSVVSAMGDPYGHTEAKAAWASRMMSALWFLAVFQFRCC